MASIVGPGVARGDLTNEEWAVLAPLLPAHPVQGRRWRDHRQVINAICWVKRTGSPWRALPERYGPWKTPYQRFRRWAADGTWARLKAQVVTLAELDDDIDWNVQIDATIVRPISTPPEPQKGARHRRHAGTRRHRTFPRRADHEDPHPGRRPRPVSGLADHTRPGCRHPAADPATRSSPGRDPRTRAPASTSALLNRRSGLLVTGQPPSVAGQAHHRHDPATP